MATPSDITVSAPGKLMLFGEHAVLHGRLSLVCAIDRRMIVRLIPHSDRSYDIISATGQTCGDLDHAAEPHTGLAFVQGMIDRWRARLPSGFQLHIETQFSNELGFGSSAAVTVALSAAFHQWLYGAIEPDAVFNDSLAVVLSVQGAGSGADIAASVYGGLVAYRAAPLEIRQHPVQHPITAVYSGKKEPTALVIEEVENRRRQDPRKFDALFDRIGRLSEDAERAVANEEWSTVGDLMTKGQAYMGELGVSNEHLDSLCTTLAAEPGILGAKISGAGLGDSIVGLGHLEDAAAFDGRAMALHINPDGVLLED